MIRVPWRAATITALSAAVAVAVATPAAATAQTTYTATASCQTGGFTGTVWFSYTKGSLGTPNYISQIKYKIDKGSNSGGNEANVYWADGSTSPTTLFSTANGVQDGQYHLFGGDYYRGGGIASMKFVFDKSNRPDPSCAENVITH